MKSKHVLFECNCNLDGKDCNRVAQKKVRIEFLNAVTGFALLVSGGLVYFLSGFEMMMSWAIFGAMYLAMDKYEEECLSEAELNSKWHQMRRVFAWVGAMFSIILVGYYLNNLFF